MDDERLVNLEARYSWIERHVAEQDKAMVELGDEIRRLVREIEALRERMGAEEGDGGGAELEDRPPHY
jgi:SlyX protein